MSAKISPSSARACAVCGASDARILVDVELAPRERAVLCGSHAVLRERVAPSATSVAALRAATIDRRSESDRRGRTARSLGEPDELGAALTAAFTGERRGRRARRAS